MHKHDMEGFTAFMKNLQWKAEITDSKNQISNS